MKQLLLLAVLLCAFLTHAATNQELERRIEILADEVNKLKIDTTKSPLRNNSGLVRNNGTYNFKGLAIGGYGEIVYTNKENENEDGDDVEEDPTAEALRNVIYFAYKFDDKWTFNTELEIEHVSEIYTEFLTLDYSANDNLNYRFGLALIPMGMINELHEPINFPSVKRPEIDKYILPTTWRELGIGAFGSKGKWSYKAYIFNGPDADAIAGTPSDGTRKGRKKGGVNNNASTAVAVLRADYNIDTNFYMGLSLLNGQASSATYSNLDMSMADVHVYYKRNAITAKLQYAVAQYTSAKSFNEETAKHGVLSPLPSELDGYYVELSYDIEGKKSSIYTPFLRYEPYNLNKTVDDDTYGDVDDSLNRTNSTIGLAYKPIANITFKTDYTYKHQEDDQGVNEFNLGMGYVF